MTAKRFKVVQGYNDRYCQDTATNKLLNQNQTVEYLNELAEENKELKSFNQDLAENLSVASNREISKDNLIERLQKENEQLKKRIDRIDIILDDLNGAEYISRDDAIKALNKIDKVVR